MQVKSKQSSGNFKRLCGVVILSLFTVFFVTGCKNFGSPDYDLKITVDAGVSGTPSAGDYSYPELTVIEYNYQPENADLTVEVLVNGSRFGTSGSFIMFNNLEVIVSIFDVRGAWDFNFRQPADSSEEDLDFQVTFTGEGYLSGSFTDNRGFTGLWSINGTILSINYSDWQNYILTGQIPLMTGEWTGENQNGTWTATRSQ
jgi:hypothetical protein